MYPDKPLISITKGTTKRWLIRLAREDDLPLNFTGSETLVARLWPGDSRASISIGCEWVLAPDQIRVTVLASDIETIETGRHRLQVIVLANGEPIEAARATLQINDGPGTSSAPLVYCDQSDLEIACPWIGEMLSPSDQTGFAEQRSRSREWLDRLILDGSVDCLNSNGERLSDLGWSLTQEILDQGGLIVDGYVKRLVTDYTLGLILEVQVGQREKTSYQTLSTIFYDRARASATAGRVKIKMYPLEADSPTVEVRLFTFASSRSGPSDSFRLGRSIWYYG